MINKISIVKDKINIKVNRTNMANNNISSAKFEHSPMTDSVSFSANAKNIENCTEVSLYRSTHFMPFNQNLNKQSSFKKDITFTQANEKESIEKNYNKNLTDNYKSKIPQAAGFGIGGVTAMVMARKIQNIFLFTSITIIGTFIGGAIGSIATEIAKYITTNKVEKQNNR